MKKRLKNIQTFEQHSSELNIYSSKDFEDMLDWDITLMDGLDEDDEVAPIYKLNGGDGAMLCNKCRTIISTGPKTDVLYCEKCEK